MVMINPRPNEEQKNGLTVRQTIELMDYSIPKPLVLAVAPEYREMLSDYFTTPRLLLPFWRWRYILRIKDKQWTWLKWVLATRKEREGFAALESGHGASD